MHKTLTILLLCFLPPTVAAIEQLAPAPAPVDEAAALEAAPPVWNEGDFFGDTFARKR